MFKLLFLCFCSTLAINNDVGFSISSNYVLKQGYVSTCNTSVDNYISRTELDSTYPCKDHGMTMKLLNHHLVDGDDGHEFDVDKFLKLLRNKTLAITGDSVALQMFHALDNELKCEETELYNGNSTQNWYWAAPAWKSKIYGAHYNAAIRKYAKYNAEIIWCGDNEMTFVSLRPHYEYCGKLALESDYIIVGLGAFYKPLYRPTNYTNYYVDMASRSLDFVKGLYAYRREIKSINPRIKIIWRDFPHVGNHDELVYLSHLNHGPDSKKHSRHNKDEHKNGLLWAFAKNEAPWVSTYNTYIKHIAQEYGDLFLEYNKLSHISLDYMNINRLRGHNDAIHWCAGGLHRYGNLLIQDKLSEAS